MSEKDLLEKIKTFVSISLRMGFYFIRTPVMHLDKGDHGFLNFTLSF